MMNCGRLLRFCICPFMVLLVFVRSAQGDSWPTWKMGFYGDGWEVHDVEDQELIKVAENQKHDVGIFVSGKHFGGTLDQLLAGLKSQDPSNANRFEIVSVGHNKAIQSDSVMSKDGEQVKVSGLLFLKAGS